MKFSIDRDVLSDLLVTARRAVQLNPPIKILVNFVLEIEGDYLIVGATNVTKTIVTSSNALTIHDHHGRIVVRASQFARLVSLLPDGELTFSASDQVAVVESGSVKTVLKLEDANSYPALPGLSALDNYVDVPSQAFSRAVEAVKGAVTTDPTRTAIYCVQTSSERFLGTDGSRVHVFVPDFEVPTLRIPVNVVSDLLTLIAKSDLENFQVGVAKNAVAYVMGDTYLTVANLAGKFPDLQPTIMQPTLANSLALTVVSDDLSLALSRVALTSDDSNAVTFSVDGDSLTLRSKNSLGSTSTDSLGCTWTGEDKHHVVLNARHVVEALDSCQAGSVRIFLAPMVKGEKPPARIVDADSGFSAILSQVASNPVLT